jgi:hypothetical protein
MDCSRERELQGALEFRIKDKAIAAFRLSVRAEDGTGQDRSRISHV